jgi:AAA domain-containing protein
MNEAARILVWSLLHNPQSLPAVRPVVALSDLPLEQDRLILGKLYEAQDAGLLDGAIAARESCELLIKGRCTESELKRVGLYDGGWSKTAGKYNSAFSDLSGFVAQILTDSNQRYIAARLSCLGAAVADGDAEGLAEKLRELTEVVEKQLGGPRKPRFEFLHWSELDQLPEPEFLPGTHIQRFSLNMWYGLTGTAKSFKALTDGYYISRSGLGTVVYVSPEGKSGWKKRVEAWRKHTGLDPDKMYFYPGAVNLLNAKEVSDFIADCKAKFPAGVALVVFDTKSRMMPGANENDVQDDGIQVANSDRIKDALNCAVLLIHHSDKKDLSARGSHATTNACDVILKFTRDGDVITTSVTWPDGKLKDGEPWTDETFRFVQSAESVVLESASKVTTEFDSPTLNQIKILGAIDAQGDAGAGTRRIAALTGLKERSVYRWTKELASMRPPLVSSLTLPKGRGERYLITIAARHLLPNSDGPNQTGKPNGNGQLVDTLANSPTVRQPFASSPHEFAATPPSIRSGEVANTHTSSDTEGSPPEETPPALPDEAGRTDQRLW